MPTATLMASFDRRRPTDVIGGAWSQSPACADCAARNLARDTASVTFEVSDDSAAEKAASLKTNKYEHLQTTHLFVPIAIETSGCFNQTGLEFITELGNRLKHVTGDKLELTYLFQRQSIAIQRGNELCFNGTFVPR